METTLITFILSSLSTGGFAYIIIKGVIERKKQEQDAQDKENDYDRAQRVNKEDWLTWLAEAKKEVEAAKQEALLARRDAEKKSLDMIALIEAHQKEMADKEWLITRLQGQVNSQDAQIKAQSAEIAALRRDLSIWKSKAPARRDAMKEEAKVELKEEIANKLTE